MCTGVLPEQYRDLFDSALKVRLNSKAKYSGFKVGAALQCKNGKIFTGTNIESSSYGLSMCAERTALFKALSEGENQFVKILIVAEYPDKQVCLPCGACRQLLADYSPGIKIIMTNTNGFFKEDSIENLLKDYFVL